MVLALLAADDSSAGTFFTYGGAAFALTLANIGAAYGTAKSSIGIANLGCV